jgi:hypothetical protein
LPAAERWRAIAWLFWKSKVKEGYDKPFEVFLDEEIELDELLLSRSSSPLATNQ